MIVKVEKENQEYIKQKEVLYDALLEFIEDSNSDLEFSSENDDENFDKLLQTIEEQNIANIGQEFEHFLKLIVCIANHHKRHQNFFVKIEKILLFFKEKIVNFMTNIQIYNIFEGNKILLLFLIKEKFVTINEEVCNLMKKKKEKNGLNFSDFFIPEMPNFSPQSIDIAEYEEKRRIGENDSYICTLIRQDLIEEFVQYINSALLPVSSSIKPSIFETNVFLIENNPTLIEYAAFFASVQIFKYLLLNNAKINQSIWIYAIHSNNSDFLVNHINYINIKQYEDDLKNCFSESIKCHHNEFAKYFEEKLSGERFVFNETVVKSILESHNYSYFLIDYSKDFAFYYLCCYNYQKIVDFHMNYLKEIIGPIKILTKIYCLIQFITLFFNIILKK